MEITKLLIPSERWLHGPHPDVTPPRQPAADRAGRESLCRPLSLSALVDVVPGEEELAKVASCANTGRAIGTETVTILSDKNS